MVENNRRTCNVRELTVRKYSECNATEPHPSFILIFHRRSVKFELTSCQQMKSSLRLRLKVMSDSY